MSQTRAAQAAFRRLQARFFDQEEARRPLLRPRLEQFLARYPGDPRASDVQALLAWVAIVEGDQPEALRRIQLARASGAPSARDFAEVAAARLLLAQKQPERALERLVALEAKLVDPAERLICSELRLQAALSSKRFADALSALTSYLAAAPADLGDRARARATTAVRALPESALEASLSELDTKARRAPLPPPEVWLRRVVRQRLIELAVQHEDAALARRLLDSHPGLARRSELSTELLRLAASAGAATQARGSFVGLALEVGEPDAERRSASAARGLSRALSAAQPGAEALQVVVKAGDAHRIGAALSELAQAGALALVAGVTDASAEQAATWAVTSKVPVLLLKDTPDLVISELSFVLGSSEIDQLDAIKKELDRRGLTNWGRVGSGGVPCRTAAEQAGSTRFPISTWQRDRVQALALMGPRSCVMEVFAEARERRFTPLLALGLEGAEALTSIPGPRFALAAGRFPETEPSQLVPADFYEALGSDAGALVRATWLALGGAELVMNDALRARLPQTLANVKVELATSSAGGFAGKRRLRRELEIREGR